MPRPKIYEEPRRATAVRLPVSLHEELKSVAGTREVSVNYLVIRALSDYLGKTQQQIGPRGSAKRDRADEQRDGTRPNEVRRTR